MARLSKAKKHFLESVERDKVYPADEAFALIKQLARAKFSESVDVATWSS